MKGFLERAEAAKQQDRKNDVPGMTFHSHVGVLSKSCWPQILAFVKAAENHKCDCGNDAPEECRGRVCCELVHARIELDKKAAV